MRTYDNRTGFMVGTDELRACPTEPGQKDCFYLEIIESAESKKYCNARLEISDAVLRHKEIVLVNRFGTVIEMPGIEYPIRYNLTARLEKPVAKRLLDLMKNGGTYRLSGFRKLGFRRA